VPASEYPDDASPSGVRDEAGRGDFRLIDITDPRVPFEVSDWGVVTDAGGPLGPVLGCDPDPILGAQPSPPTTGGRCSSRTGTRVSSPSTSPILRTQRRRRRPLGQLRRRTGVALHGRRGLLQDLRARNRDRLQLPAGLRLFQPRCARADRRVPHAELARHSSRCSRGSANSTAHLRDPRGSRSRPGTHPITTVGRYATVEAAQLATDEVWGRGGPAQPASRTKVSDLGWPAGYHARPADRRTMARRKAERPAERGARRAETNVLRRAGLL
jgi:hypothetical protein